MSDSSEPPSPTGKSEPGLPGLPNANKKTFSRRWAKHIEATPEDRPPSETPTEAEPAVLPPLPVAPALGGKMPRFRSSWAPVVPVPPPVPAPQALPASVKSEKEPARKLFSLPLIEDARILLTDSQEADSRERPTVQVDLRERPTVQVHLLDSTIRKERKAPQSLPMAPDSPAAPPAARAPLPMGPTPSKTPSLPWRKPAKSLPGPEPLPPPPEPPPAPEVTAESALTPRVVAEPAPAPAPKVTPEPTLTPTVTAPTPRTARTIERIPLPADLPPAPEETPVAPPASPGRSSREAVPSRGTSQAARAAVARPPTEPVSEGPRWLLAVLSFRLTRQRAVTAALTLALLVALTGVRRLSVEGKYMFSVARPAGSQEARLRFFVANARNQQEVRVPASSVQLRTEEGYQCYSVDRFYYRWRSVDTVKVRFEASGAAELESFPVQIQAGRTGLPDAIIDNQSEAPPQEVPSEAQPQDVPSPAQPQEVPTP